MQWSLFLLILMGQCSFFTCQLYEYHFIEETKTWDEAQKYCREKYKDLATVSNMRDMKRLLESTQSQDEAWIDLHSSPGQNNRTWYWSLPGVEFNESETRWKPGQPDDHGGHLENCALMTDGKWSDFPCISKHNFICYNESKQSNKRCQVITNKMTWSQAQNYCREKHTDLISGLHQLDDCTKPGSYMWIGLFRDTWRWSDEHTSSFRYWENNKNFLDAGRNEKCAMTLLSKMGKWSSDDCDKRKPFFCYDNKFILIKENKTWVEALSYCRKNYFDLASITNLHVQKQIQERTKNANSSHVWLGLRYTCTLDLWFWVTDELVCYDNWAPGQQTDECWYAAAMETGGQHEWIKRFDNETFNFICSMF